MNLKEIERKAWRSTYQDGLLDIFLGLLLLTMGVGAWLSDTGAAEGLQIAAFAGMQIVAMAVFVLGKRFITIPRLGFVRFGPEGRTRKKRALWLGITCALAGLVVLAITLVVRTDPGDRLVWEVIIPAIYVLAMIVFFSLGAYFLDVARLYVIGLMYAVALPLDLLMGAVFHADLTLLAFGVPAMVVLAMGMAMLVRFLRAYPLPKGEEGGRDANR